MTCNVIILELLFLFLIHHTALHNCRSNLLIMRNDLLFFFSPGLSLCVFHFKGVALVPSSLFYDCSGGLKEASYLKSFKNPSKSQDGKGIEGTSDTHRCLMLAPPLF